MKVVATTATIRGEDRQCEHLFGLRSVVVPLPGPSLEESFYWRIDPAAPQRRYVGIQPTPGHRRDGPRPDPHAFHPGSPAAGRMAPPRFRARGRAARALDALCDLVPVSLTYVTSLVDFGKLRRSIETQVNEYLRSQGLDEVSVASSTATPSSTRFATLLTIRPRRADRVRHRDQHGLPRRRRGPAQPDGVQRHAQVHGRVHPGQLPHRPDLPRRRLHDLQPVRERDRSHFRYHGKFHEYLDRMVEPVAINRWSRYAARKTLPGLFMAELLQVANRAFWDAGSAPPTCTT